MSNPEKKSPFTRKWAFTRKVASNRQLAAVVFMLIIGVFSIICGAFSYKKPEETLPSTAFKFTFIETDAEIKNNLDIRDPSLTFAIESPVSHDNIDVQYRQSIRQLPYPALRIQPPEADKWQKLSEGKVTGDMTFLQRISPMAQRAPEAVPLTSAPVFDQYGKTVGKIARDPRLRSGTTVIEIVQNGYMRRTSLLVSCGSKENDALLERFLRTTHRLAPGRYTVHWHTPAPQSNPGGK